MRLFAKMPLLEVGRFQVHRIGTIVPIHDALLEGRTRHSPAHSRTAHRTQFRRSPERRGVSGKSSPSSLASRDARRKECSAALGPYRAMLESAAAALPLALSPGRCGFQGGRAPAPSALRDYCIYFEGNGPDDPLFLQIKEEAPSGYTPYLPGAHAAAPQRPARRRGPARHAVAVRSVPGLDAHRRLGTSWSASSTITRAAHLIEDLAGSGLIAFARSLRRIACSGPRTIRRSA